MKKIFLILSASLSLLGHAVSPEEHPVVIIGGGVGALTAATYLGRGGVQPLVLSGPILGGAITQSHCVQNWPGEKEISGWELAEKMRVQAEQNGAEIRYETVVQVDLSRRPFLITTRNSVDGTETEHQIKAQSLIVASGATPNRLGVKGEEGYWSRGVYSCAVCDGAFYKDKVVAIVGGGDSALLEAQYLSNLARKVYLIVRKETFRTVEKQRAQEILSHPRIEVLYQRVVEEIKGDDDRVSGLVLKHLPTETLQHLPVDALFLAIGSKPNTALFRNQLELDHAGYIVLKNHQETSVTGVYAVGDVSDPKFKQAVSAAGDGAKAALQVQEDLTQYLTQHIAKASAEPSRPSVIDVATKEEFQSEIHHADGVVFVDFYANYCGPCRMFSPTYEGWAKEFKGRIKFLKVDAQKVPQLFDQYQVRGIPTMIVLDAQGNVIRRMTGLQEIARIDRKLDEVRFQSRIDAETFKKMPQS